MPGVNFPGNLACPSCGSTDTGVMDSRGTPEGWIRRRRRCNGCGVRLTTYEVNADELEASLREIRAIRVASVALAKLIEGLPANRTKTVGTLNCPQPDRNGDDFP